MAKCRRPMPAEGQQVLQVMTRDLRDRLRVFGWTHTALAKRLGCDRSRISHARTRRRGVAATAADPVDRECPGRAR